MNQPNQKKKRQKNPRQIKAARRKAINELEMYRIELEAVRDALRVGREAWEVLEDSAQSAMEYIDYAIESLSKFA